MAAAAAAKEAAASTSQTRAPMPLLLAHVRGLLFGLPPDARAEDIEYVLDDVQRTISRLDSKRSSLQDQIAAVSRGKRRAPRRRAPPPVAPAVVVGAPVPAAEVGDDPGARDTSTREGAGDVKKEKKRLEAVWGDLEEALVDARERLAVQPGERTA